jgi:hypothetical protein
VTDKKIEKVLETQEKARAKRLQNLEATKNMVDQTAAEVLVSSETPTKTNKKLSAFFSKLQKSLEKMIKTEQPKTA